MISKYSRRHWYPQGLKLEWGKGFTKPEEKLSEHCLGDKTIADVCEAIIGAALFSYKDTGDKDLAVRAVTVLVANDAHTALEWSDYYPLYQKPAYLLLPAFAREIELAKIVERTDRYHFKNPRLLFSAFLHPSFPFSWSQGVPCYERLEFLGDALLDMVNINLLFEYDGKDPQWLTEHKV